MSKMTVTTTVKVELPGGGEFEVTETRQTMIGGNPRFIADEVYAGMTGVGDKIWPVFEGRFGTSPS